MQRYQQQNVGCPRTVWRWLDCSRDLRKLKHIRRHSLFSRPPLISHLQSERRNRLAARSKPRDDTRGHRIVNNKVSRIALTGRLGWRKVKVVMRDLQTQKVFKKKNVQRQIHGADVPVMSQIIRTEENSQLFLFSPGVCVYRVFCLLCLSLILIFVFLHARIWRKLWKETSTEMKANSPKKPQISLEQKNPHLCVRTGSCF